MLWGLALRFRQILAAKNSCCLHLQSCAHHLVLSPCKHPRLYGQWLCVMQQKGLRDLSRRLLGW